MAKRKAARRASPAKRAKKGPARKRSAKRPTRAAASKAKRRSPTKKSTRRPAVLARSSRRSAAKRPTARPKAKAATRSVRPIPKAVAARTSRKPPATVAKKAPRLDRVRRTLDDTIPTPPSSLDMERHGSAARTGRAEMAEHLHDHGSLTPAITAGDVDVDVEDAYFTGDESPGGDNPTPDQDVVDDIGKALGVQYDDNEELKASDKITERDRHRWEMDPASSEDYKDRK